MTFNEALTVLGSIAFGLLMFFAGKGVVKKQQAEADKQAKAKADKVEKEVQATPVDKAREELKGWKKR